MKVKGTVQSVSGPREFNNLLQIGFVLKENPNKWYNIPGNEETLKKLKDQSIIKGNEIIFEYTEKTGEVKEITVVKKAEKKEGNWSDDITNFETLLDAAHKKFKGKLEIRTEIVKDGDGRPMIDFEKKRAIFQAAVTANGCVFEGHGETTEENTSGDTAKSWLRIAETRSIVRALRWATNNATCADEEKPGKK